jgi:hypothetical protein
MAEDESDDKKLDLQGFIKATAKDLVSHHATLLRLAENDEAEHSKVLEMAEEIRRLKAWTGLPEKDDPRGPAPGTLWGLAAVTRDLILRVWKHLGLPEDQIGPTTKGGAN